MKTGKSTGREESRERVFRNRIGKMNVKERVRERVCMRKRERGKGGGEQLLVHCYTIR